MPRTRRRPKSDAELWKQVSKWKPGFTGKQARARLGPTQWRRARNLAVERGQLAASKEVTKRHRTRVRYAVEAVPRAGAPRKGLERTQPEEYGWMRSTVKVYIVIESNEGSGSRTSFEIEFSDAAVPLGLSNGEPVNEERIERMITAVTRAVRRENPDLADRWDDYKHAHDELQVAMQDSAPIRKQADIEWGSTTLRIFRPSRRGMRVWSKHYKGGAVRA